MPAVTVGSDGRTHVFLSVSSGLVAITCDEPYSRGRSRRLAEALDDVFAGRRTFDDDRADRLALDQQE